jgi:hypothetical protein
MLQRFLCIGFSFLLAGTLPAAPPPGYTPKVTVAGPTRLDWVFTVASQSPATPPAKLLAEGYDSAKQSYELFLPPRKDPKQPLPAVLFISAGDEPQGWKAFKGPCEELGIAFIGVRGAGNGVPFPQRCRVLLDCFDDVRRQVPLNPDRTYVAGFSGGARAACAIGFALPEYFGGILSVAAGGELRDEPWLRHRAIDRLSVALVTGESDFNRGEVERWRGPFWKEIGIRTRAWTFDTGHALPPAAGIAEALRWLDEAKEKRAALAKQFPSTRATPAGAPSREEAAKALLTEGKEKVKKRPTLHAGLMLLKGCLERWPDLPAAEDAKKLLLDFERKKERPWEADDVAEQLRYLVAEAKALGDYALEGIPPDSQYARQRPAIARRAVQLWETVITNAADSEAAREGKKRLPDLEKLAGSKK